MKRKEELKNGKCIVVAEAKGIRKEFEGEYVEKFNLVFMAIPSHYKVIGYIQ